MHAGRSAGRLRSDCSSPRVAGRSWFPRIPRPAGEWPAPTVGPPPCLGSVMSSRGRGHPPACLPALAGPQQLQSGGCFCCTYLTSVSEIAALLFILLLVGGASPPVFCCLQGEDGLQGPKGDPGAKGNQGRRVSNPPQPLRKNSLPRRKRV